MSPSIKDGFKGKDLEKEEAGGKVATASSDTRAAPSESGVLPVGHTVPRATSKGGHCPRAGHVSGLEDLAAHPGTGVCARQWGAGRLFSTLLSWLHPAVELM